MQRRRFLTGFGGCGQAVLLAFFAVLGLAVGAAEPILLAPDERAIIDKVAKSIRADVQYGKAPAESQGGEITFPFRDGTITLVRTSSFVREDGSISWRGIVKETGERAALMVWGKTVLTGYFAYDGAIFAIENLGGGLHAFAELGRDKALPDHPAPAAARDSAPIPSLTETSEPRAPPAEPPVAPFSDQDRQALEAKAITIDVMLFYTPNVAAHYVRDPSDLLAVAIEETNESFRNSGLGNISLRLVHTQPLNYDGSMDDQFHHLYSMADGAGPFKDVKRLRNEKRADIVGLVIDNPNGCGLSTRIGPESDEAYFVVHHACVTVSMSIAH